MEILNKSLGKVRGFGKRSDFYSFFLENVYQMDRLLLVICCEAGVVSLTCLYFFLSDLRFCCEKKILHQS